jgi:Uma2 family endonuclease
VAERSRSHNPPTVCYTSAIITEARISPPVTYTSVRYKSYRDYLAADLGSDGNFRLLSNGEVIELPPEDERNTSIADELAFTLKQIMASQGLSKRLVKASSVELQVHPIGDQCVNRKPDVLVLRPEHIELMAALNQGAVLFDMPPPAFVAEMVSPGSESSDNYRRDYEWKRQQYQAWQIPEYWIVDRHRQQITVLILKDEQYSAQIYRGDERIRSAAFPRLNYTAAQLLLGEA